MDPISGNDTCIRCHSQGRPLASPIGGQYYDWPVGYRVGLQLRNFWKLEACGLGQTTFYYFPDCTTHKNRMQGHDLVQSVMYGHGIMGSSCHDVHGTENRAQLRAPGNQLCLECHGTTSPDGPHTATLEGHTHHRMGSPGSECVAPYAEDRDRRRSRYVRACASAPLYRARDDGSIQNSQSVYDLSRGEIDGLGRGSDQSLARVVGVEDSIDALRANSGRYAELLCNCGHSFIGSQAVGMFVSVSHYD
jgi:predicted CXXCH cytochrome family protein